MWRGIDGLAGDLVLAMMPAVLLTSSLASHAAALPGWSPLAIAADWLHFMAITAWLGGLASMVFVLPAVVRAGGTPGAGLFTKPVARFSERRVGVCCRGRADWRIPGLAGARVVAGARPDRVRPEHLGEDRAHRAHAWLRCIQHLVARPRLSALVARRIAALGGVARAFGRSVRAELAVGVLVLAVAAVLTGLAPGRGDLARETGAQPSPVDRRLDAQALAPRVRISPATVGQNHLAVELAWMPGRPRSSECNSR